MFIIAVIFYAIYEVVCLWLTHSSFDYYENICTLSCYHCQIDNIYHATVFRPTSWNNGICCILHCFYRQWRDSNKYIYIIKPHEFATLGILAWTIHIKQNMWICCRTYFSSAQNSLGLAVLRVNYSVGCILIHGIIYISHLAQLCCKQCYWCIPWSYVSRIHNVCVLLLSRILKCAAPDA